jgi:hypothetical protein
MEARIYASNENLEVFRGSFVSRMDIKQASKEDIQEEIIPKMDTPSEKDGSLYECPTKRETVCQETTEASLENSKAHPEKMKAGLEEM